MIKNAYMLQGSYGSFGLTAAMLRRCDEFLARNIHCVSLTLDFTPNIYSYVTESKAIGKVPEKLECRNPYIDIAIQADNWLDKVGNHIASCFLFSYLDTDTVIYYKTNGYKLNQKNYNKKDRVSCFEYKGKTINEVFLVDDIRVEYNYSTEGLCLSIREFEHKSNKQLKCLIFDYTLGVIKQYKSSYQWNVEWMKVILPKTENTVLICDGPGSARKLIEVKRNNIKVIYVMHNNHKHDNNKLTKRDAWNLENKNKFDAIIPLTERHKKDLVKDFGDSNFYNIFNFTNIKNTDININFEPFRIGFFGQLIDRKGVKDAIQALGLLHKKYHLLARLDIFGGTANPTDMDKSINKYMEIVKEKNLEDFVTFHGYTNKVLEEMAKCHCIIFPSNSEAQPLTIVEAMSLGVPVVAYDCKYGPSSMIDNGKNGYLSNVGDIAKLAKNANNILTNSKLRDEMSELAKESSKSFTDSERIFQQWEKMFFELSSK